MPVYNKLQTLSKNKFDAPVSMAKIVDMAVNKSYEEFKNKDEHRK